MDCISVKHVNEYKTYGFTTCNLTDMFSIYKLIVKDEKMMPA